MNRRTLLTIYLLAAVCLILAFVTGYMVRDLVRLRTSEFPIFAQAYEIIQDRGYHDLPEAPAIDYGLIRGLIDAYGDPFTSFLEPVQHELETNDLQGSFGGIGVNLVREPDGILHLYPFPDSPAARAGVQDADQLIAVGELEVLPETAIEDVQAAVRGPVGENVTITVLREPGPDELEFTIPRESVSLPSVTWYLSEANPLVGVIDINILAASTAQEVETAAADLQADGATHIVLDLRDNSGGLLDAGVDTARLFLSQGTVIEQQFRGEPVKSYQVESPGSLADLPLIVLINQNTASAAEIVAGALQNLDRSELVGQPSYGKDSIQLVFDLSDGSSIHVTAARWWLPGFPRLLSDGGLEPDLAVSTEASDQDVTLQAAIDRVLSGAE